MFSAGAFQNSLLRMDNKMMMMKMGMIMMMKTILMTKMMMIKTLKEKKEGMHAKI